MFRMRSDLSEASSVMVEGRVKEPGSRAAERERERKFLVSLYQEEWTPLLLSLTVGNAGEGERQMLVNPLIDTNRY